MPFDGNGIYNPVSPPLFPAVSGTTITSNQYNTQILDMAAALSNCMTRDGQGKPTGNIDFNSQKLTNLGVGTDPADAVRRDQITTLVNSNIATNGVTLNNNVAVKLKDTGGNSIPALYIGADNNIYFGYDTSGNWFMRYEPANNRVVFNKNIRVVGTIIATQNIGAFQP